MFPPQLQDTCPTCGQPAKDGIEVRGTYDGVLIWVCPEGHRYPRFPKGHQLHQAALDFLAQG